LYRTMHFFTRPLHRISRELRLPSRGSASSQGAPPPLSVLAFLLNWSSLGWGRRGRRKFSGWKVSVGMLVSVWSVCLICVCSLSVCLRGIFVVCCFLVLICFDDWCCAFVLQALLWAFACLLWFVFLMFCADWSVLFVCFLGSCVRVSFCL
jgi:hypothetical protein